MSSTVPFSKLLKRAQLQVYFSIIKEVSTMEVCVCSFEVCGCREPTLLSTQCEDSTCVMCKFTPRCKSNLLTLAANNLLLHRIQISHLPSAISVVKLVKMSALVSRRLWVRIPPKNDCEFLRNRFSESIEHAVLIKINVRYSQEIPN